MYSKEVTVMNASGLHARPASNLVQFCAKFPCKLTMTGGRSPVDLKSIFAVLSAAVKAGTTVTITGDGADEQQAVDEVCRFIEQLEG